jgi:branched-chain amino acid transport system substrate-binding protein
VFNVHPVTARLLSTAAAALIAAIACSGGAIAPGLPAGPVRVGLVTSLTRIDLPLGLDVRQGAQLAVAEANAGGGVAGHQVELQVADDQGSATGAGSAFSGLAAGGVVGVVGPLNAAGGEAVAKLAARKHLPILSTSGADQVTRSGTNILDNVFLAAPAASRSATRMLKYAKQASLPTLAVAHPTGDAFADSGVAAVNAQAAQFGARVVSDQPYDPAAVDFTALIAGVRASGAKLLLVWGSAAAPPILERAWKDSGLGIPILLSVASSSTAFLRAVSDSGEGALVEASTSLLAGSLPAGSAVRKQVDPMATAFQRQNGYYPTQAAFDGYAAVRLLLAAIAAAGSADPARIDAELSRLNLATAAGTFKFSPTDHLGLAADWLTIAVVKDGKLTLPSP